MEGIVVYSMTRAYVYYRIPSGRSKLSCASREEGLPMAGFAFMRLDLIVFIQTIGMYSVCLSCWS